MEKKTKRKESKVLLPLRMIISVCESKENKRDFFLNHETCTRIIVIDLINSELIRSLSRGFFFQREKIFHVNICVLVCNCYFGLLM